MSRKRLSRTDRRSQSKGRFASFTVHLLLLLMAFLPFLSFHAPEPPTKEALVIQFDYPYNQYVAPEKFEDEKMKMPETANLDEASKMSGSEGGGNETKAEPIQSRPQQTAPTALATPSTPTVLKNTSSPIRTMASDIPLPMPKIYTSQAWASVEDVSSSETDRVQEMRLIDSGTGGFGNVAEPGGGDGDDDSSVYSDGFGGQPGGAGGTGNGTGNTTGDGSGPGGGTGTGNAGNKTGVGDNGTGMDWGVGLDGLLNRKLIKRAEVAKLAEREGKIAIYICVDQMGKVVGTKYDVVASTLKDDPAFIAKAEACAMSYQWAPDPSAPPKQCGKLTFSFKIQK